MKIFIILLVSFFTYHGVFAQTTTLSLNDAINAALENNYGIIIGEKNIDVSTINNSWGKAGALPTISLAGSGGETWKLGNLDSRNEMLNASTNVNWVLFRGFSVRINKEMLEELQILSEGNATIIIENTIINVLLGYYNVLLTKAQIDISITLMDVSEDRYNQEEMRKEMGSSVTYDLLQAKNAWLEDKANNLRAKTSYKNAVNQLNYVMAAPLENDYDFISDFVADTTQFDFADLSERLLANNNTLRNQYLNLELKEKEIRLAKSNYMPTVSIGASGGYTNSANYYENSKINNGFAEYNTGVNFSLSYTIYQGGTRKSAVQISKINQEIAEIQTVDMEQSLLNQLSQDFQQYELDCELLSLAKENLKVADLNMELTEQKFKNGAISSFNFRDVQNIYLNANMGYLQATFNVINSYNSLLRLTGGVLDVYNK